MFSFVQLTRIFFLITVCCSAAFAHMYPNRFSMAVDPGARSALETVPVAVTNARETDVQTRHLLTPTLRVHNSFEPPEPFNLPVISALPGEKSEIWGELQSRIAADERALVACSKNKSACSQAAQRFLALVELGQKHQGRARLGWINRLVNLSIKPVSDWAQYGYPDYWASPLQTLGRGAGDCEDYAIVKYILLLHLGFPASDLRLVIVRDKARRADHAVVAVRTEQKWLILDNRTMTLLDAEVAQHYQALLSFNQQAVRILASATTNNIIDR
jgi:predicted transglutaminase-like cysteine proteinase